MQIKSWLWISRNDVNLHDNKLLCWHVEVLWVLTLSVMSEPFVESFKR